MDYDFSVGARGNFGPDIADHDYPPGAWDVDALTEALDGERTGPVPSYDEVEAWERIRSDPTGGPAVRELLESAEDQRTETPPLLPASLHLEITRTGNRTRYEDPEGKRVSRLRTFANAECFDREGRYLDPILDYAWAICEQTSWLSPAVLPQEQSIEGLPVQVPPENRWIALRSSGIAHLMAEVDYLHGDRLHPALRTRIRTELDEQIFTPYERRDDIWWMNSPTNNWNAVANGNVAMAAMYVEDDVERRARIVKKAVDRLHNYLNRFDEDGCTPEGVQYWNYGFGHFVKFAAHLEAATNGEFTLMEVPIVERIARLPLEIELSPGHAPAFSDATEDASPNAATACWLGDRLDIPELAARGRQEFDENQPSGLRALTWCSAIDPTEEYRWSPPLRAFFRGHGWWVSRVDPATPDGLAVATKGGRNAESHNHNDCGSVIVHYRGESSITDIGRPTYERGYGTNRFEYLAARSLGHSVPYVNGTEQAAGADYFATVQDRVESADRDAITYELAAAYPDETGLESLRRTVTLDRSAEAVTIDDELAFAEDAPGESWESVLVSWFPMEADDGSLTIEGDAVTTSVEPAAAATIDVERLEDAIDVTGHTTDDTDFRDVWRARLTPEDRSLTLRIDPA